MEFIVEICGKMDYYIEIMGAEQVCPDGIMDACRKRYARLRLRTASDRKADMADFRARVRTRRRMLWNFMWR